MNENIDCIIVGGGPAGMATALTLASKGKKVVILDRKKHELIGKKVCGDALEALSPKLLFDKIGIREPFGDEIASHISSGTISTKEASITRTAPGYTMNRHIYGQRLLRECIEKEVIIIDEANVRGVIIENNFVIGINYIKNKKKEKIYSTLTIDCSGTLGAIRSKLPKAFSYGLIAKIPDEYVASSYREIIELDEPHPYKNEIIIMYEPNIPPPGYIWLFPKGPNKLNVGTGWLKSEKNITKPMKKLFKEVFEKYYTKDSYRVITKGGGLITMRPPLDCCTFNGGMIVGEAACMTDPLSAEGHSPALVSGYYAGIAASNAIDKGDVSRNGMWQYNMDIMSIYGVRNIVSLITSKHMNIIKPEDMNYILKKELITQNELDNILDGGTADIDLKSVIKKIIKAFPRLGVLMKVKRLGDEINKVKTIYENYPTNPDDLPSWRKTRNKALKMKL